ncbi:MAG: dihydropteroate synthase-like protein [Archaeoglobaceae archaeon]
MRILLVTGLLAEPLVRKYCGNSDVYVVKKEIAAFITPRDLENLDLRNYDLVLVPGLTAGNDWKSLEEKKGVKIRLGPIHAYDLQYVLKFAEKIDFSHEIPACRLIQATIAKEFRDKVDSLDKNFLFKIGDVPVGGESRMKVVAEVHAFSNLEELERKIDYLSENADIIDIGIPLEFDSDFIKKAIKRAVEVSEKPISIDTFSKKAIEIGVDCGVDMIMSLSKENFDAIGLIEDQAIVVVEKNVYELKSLVEKAKRRKEKVIADPVLDPPLGTASSIIRYAKYRELDTVTPLLFGAGNVTELSDADSVGINALLAFIAEELNCNLLFTTEASPKTFGCVKELKIASYLSKAAKIRNAPPKDVGISLLALKEKFRYPEPSPKQSVEAKEYKEFVRDPLGDFIIYVADGRIFCEHEKLTVSGKKAKEILDTVISKGLLSRLDHAAYLGRELMKAEIALRLKKNYIQDQELNFGFY